MNSHLPSRIDAWHILRTAQPPAWVLRHVACVESLALAMTDKAKANGHKLDRDLVQVGAVLHDIGRSITQDPRHAHLGAELLRDQDMDDAVVRIVERHTGAGLTADEAVTMQLPSGAYTPETLEEQIVAHADNLYSGDRRLTMEQVKAKYEAKGLSDAFARIQELHEHLCEVCGLDVEDLEPAQLPTA